MPLTGPQTAGYESDADELFYGGSAGGGKSDLLLGLSGTQHHRSIIFRRVFPSLRGIIERSREIFNARGDAHARDSYNESLHIWRLADGRQVEFGSLQFEKDKESYRGRPHDFYGWDEITEFTESQFRFVNTWCRTTRPGQRTRIVATGNPPTSAEGEWVIRYWSPWLDGQHTNPAKPGELRWFVRIDDKDVEVESRKPVKHDGEKLIPRSRTFIADRLSDNPILESTGYGAVLQGLPEPLRSQLLYGDFSVGIKDDPYQVIPTEWIREAMRRQPSGDPMAMTALGVDVARGGKDKTVLAPLYGNVMHPLVRIPGADTPNGGIVAQSVVNMLRDSAVAGVDVIGVGASVYDACIQVGVNTRGINFAEGTTETDRTRRLRFSNVRAAAYWRMREWLEPPSDVVLPDDAELLTDLCAPRWALSGGKITIESKDDIVKRIGRSPDAGDAVVLANYAAQTNALQIFL